jgi:hypothetical protein
MSEHAALLRPTVPTPRSTVDRLRISMAASTPQCTHCGSPLKRWLVPDGASWPDEFFYVCFNDECSYYKEGWVWMWEQYRQKASYRFALNPTTGASLMIPVWSDDATRDRIVEDAEGTDDD